VPEISIVIPCFNAEAYLGPCLESVLAQTFKDWECIVVDDDSKDDSRAFINAYCRADARFRLIELEENQGPANARACAIAEAAGKYVAFLDSDDVWKPEKLEIQLKWMVKQGIPFSCTSYGKIDHAGKDLNFCVRPPATWDYSYLLRDCPGNSTVMVETELLRDIKIPNIKKRNDYLLWLQVIKRAGCLYGLDNLLAFHRVHNQGISSSKTSLIKYHWIIYRRHEELGFWLSARLIFHWVVEKGIVRFLKKRRLLGR
jgi:glycosyltransferase involved in cell wall biosynthesis